MIKNKLSLLILINFKEKRDQVHFMKTLHQCMENLKCIYCSVIPLKSDLHS
jgi:hypothetical protein